ncbi:MAG: hypothetical protein RL105_850 [Verrucomicrobiota bacterium]|jgi:mono/diheme cytochrome c family protein/glucose/arabinose dehydrogenase
MPRLASAVGSILLSCLPLLAQIGDKSDKPGVVQSPIVPADLIPPSPPLTPEQALKSFTVAPGYRVELVAAEPLVRHPTVLQFAPDGRLWVVEMTGYMEDFDGTTEDQPKGAVVTLADTDGDGRMDKRTVFLDNIILPRALVLHRDGVLVGAPPHLWFCRDTDGDGRADEKTEVAADFGVRVDPSRPQLANPERAPNALLWGHDGWLYVGAMTARFRPDGGRWIRETSNFRGQWGLAQDDYGRLYSNNNSDFLRVDVVNSGYLFRNPNLGRTTGLNTKAAAEQTVWPARVNPGINRGYRPEMLRDFRLKECTAACGPWVYRSDLFPADAYGNAFICEPAGNLVKRLVLKPDEAGLVKGTPYYDQKEFLASTDERFRPVNALTGPEGALYLVDMHHGVIQHRISLTSYLRKQGESRGLIAPHGMGRIWRVVPEGRAPAVLAKLSALSPRELIAELGSGNEWRRETAQRLIVESGDRSLVPALTAFGAQTSSPMGRVHALWAQHGLKSADWTLVDACLIDADPRVRAAALRVSEPLVSGERRADVLARWNQMAAVEAVPQVQLQLILSMGEARALPVDLAAARLAQRAAGLLAAQDAFISGLAGRELEVMEAVLKDAASYSKTLPAALLRCVFAERKPERVARALAVIGAQPLRSTQVTLLGSLAVHPTVTAKRPVALPEAPKALLKFLASKDATTLKAANAVKSILTWPGKPGAVAGPKPLSNEEARLFDLGRQTYAGLCAACHQPTGKGQEGLAPPLAESEWVLGDPETVTKIVLHGLRGPVKVKGVQYSLDMPAAGFLTDEQVAGVLTYIRREWDHEASPVTPDFVAKVRLANARRSDAWTAPELVSKQ